MDVMEREGLCEFDEIRKVDVLNYHRAWSASSHVLLSLLIGARAEDEHRAPLYGGGGPRRVEFGRGVRKTRNLYPLDLSGYVQKVDRNAAA